MIRKSRSSEDRTTRPTAEEGEVVDEFVRQKKDTERPGPERSIQFRNQENMKGASFSPKRSKDNPL